MNRRHFLAAGLGGAMATERLEEGDSGGGQPEPAAAGSGADPSRATSPRGLCLAIAGAVVLLGQSVRAADADQHIRPYEKNPRYWQYRGEPVLLLGGSREDNLFNHPEGLAEHLDTLAACGGNYIRNTMSSRNPGNPWAFRKLDNGLYDLNQWNDEYWTRLETLLRLCRERDIIVQIEVWDPWDYFKTEAPLGYGPGNVGWESCPFNPALNVNYTAAESGLAEQINNVKIYGGEIGRWTTSVEEGTQRFWRNVFGGCASSRFHRPGPSHHYFAIGLSELAQTHIRSMRMLTGRIDVFTCEPRNDLLAERAPNEAYCLANPGKEYAVYFPAGGEVVLDASAARGRLELRWLDILRSAWRPPQQVHADAQGRIRLKPPGDGPWAAWIAVRL